LEEAAFRSVLTAENEGDRKMEGIWLRLYWEEGYGFQGSKGIKRRRCWRCLWRGSTQET
jgi:hypothetical protein